MPRFDRPRPRPAVLIRRCAAAVVLYLLCAATGSSAFAGYEQGLQAFDRGDFGGAYREWLPLAQAGDPRAQHGVGLLYETGYGVERRNYGEALKWYRSAAAQGLPAALSNIALMYAEGRGVAQDLSQAAALWEQAAVAGLPMAQFNLGLMYFGGRGVSPDDGLAARWFAEAAAQGLVDAQFAIGEMYRLGRGVNKDLAEARRWFAMAAAAGYPAASERLAVLGGLPEQGPPATATLETPSQPTAPAASPPEANGTEPPVQTAETAPADAASGTGAAEHSSGREPDDAGPATQSSEEAELPDRQPVDGALRVGRPPSPGEAASQTADGEEPVEIEAAASTGGPATETPLVAADPGEAPMPSSSPASAAALKDGISASREAEQPQDPGTAGRKVPGSLPSADSPESPAPPPSVPLSGPEAEPVAAVPATALGELPQDVSGDGQPEAAGGPAAEPPVAEDAATGPQNSNVADPGGFREPEQLAEVPSMEAAGAPAQSIGSADADVQAVPLPDETGHGPEASHDAGELGFGEPDATDETAALAEAPPEPGPPPAPPKDVGAPGAALHEAPPPEAKAPPEKFAPSGDHPAPPSAPEAAVVAPQPDKVYRIWLTELEDAEEAEAAAEWRRLLEAYPDLLAQREPVLRRIERSDGIRYRILAGPFANRAGAAALCALIRSREPDEHCMVVLN